MPNNEGWLYNERLRLLLGNRSLRHLLRLGAVGNIPPQWSELQIGSLLSSDERSLEGIELLGRLNEEKFLLRAEKQFQWLIEAIGPLVWQAISSDFFENNNIPPAATTNEALNSLLKILGQAATSLGPLGLALIEFEEARLQVFLNGGTVRLESCSPSAVGDLRSHPLFSRCVSSHFCIVYGEQGDPKCFRRRHFSSD